MAIEGFLTGIKGEIAITEWRLWQPILRKFYSRLYQGEASYESPWVSVTQMCQRILESKPRCRRVAPRMIDIGSGAQYLEARLLKANGSQSIKDWEIHTLDFAHIPERFLCCRRAPNVTHHECSALNLPFPDSHFGLVVSNFAIDLLPHQAIEEASRVLAPEGDALFNLHYPSEVYERVLKGWKGRAWRSLGKIERPFGTEQQICRELSEVDLQVERIKISQSYEPSIDRHLEYWEVDAIKS